MKTKDGFIQGYNAQAAVDATAQIIVAHGLTQSMSDQAATGAAARCASRPISAASPRRFRPTPAIAARTIWRRSRRGRSTPISPPGRAKHPGRDHAQGRRRRLTQTMRTQAQARRLSQPIPIAKADRGAGVRTDQASTRLPAVPAARHRESAGRMGADLHRPQPHKAGGDRMTPARNYQAGSSQGIINQPVPDLSGRAPSQPRVM